MKKYFKELNDKEKKKILEKKNNKLFEELSNYIYEYKMYCQEEDSENILCKIVYNYLHITQ